MVILIYGYYKSRQILIPFKNIQKIFDEELDDITYLKMVQDWGANVKSAFY